MDYRPLGRTSQIISRIGLGCMGMSEFYGPADDDRSLAVLERAFELGVNVFDTADMYGRGRNEELVGRFLRGKHDRAVVATKCGIVRDEVGDGRRIDTRPAHIRAACEASLRRLRVERIDLYYLHRLDGVTPIEDSMGALADLKAAGKIAAVGLSEVAVGVLERAAAIHPVSAVQSEYSLLTRDPAVEGVIDACEQLGATFVPYSPLGRGLLTAGMGASALADDDFRRRLPRFQPGALERNVALVERLTEVARPRGATAAQVALAWVLARGPHVTPIPGARSIARLEENVDAAAIELSPADIQAIEAFLPAGAAVGDRYPTDLMPR